MLEYSKIVNPENGLLINVRSKKGKRILRSYIDKLSGGFFNKKTSGKVLSKASKNMNTLGQNALKSAKSQANTIGQNALETAKSQANTLGQSALEQGKNKANILAQKAKEQVNTLGQSAMAEVQYAQAEANAALELKKEMEALQAENGGQPIEGLDNLEEVANMQEALAQVRALRAAQGQGQLNSLQGAQGQGQLNSLQGAQDQGQLNSLQGVQGQGQLNSLQGALGQVQALQATQGQGAQGQGQVNSLQGALGQVQALQAAQGQGQVNTQQGALGQLNTLQVAQNTLQNAPVQPNNVGQNVIGISGSVDEILNSASPTKEKWEALLKTLPVEFLHSIEKDADLSKLAKEKIKTYQEKLDKINAEEKKKEAELQIANKKKIEEQKKEIQELKNKSKAEEKNKDAASKTGDFQLAQKHQSEELRYLIDAKNLASKYNLLEHFKELDGMIQKIEKVTTQQGGSNDIFSFLFK